MTFWLVLTMFKKDLNFTRNQRNWWPKELLTYENGTQILTASAHQQQRWKCSANKNCIAKCSSRGRRWIFYHVHCWTNLNSRYTSQGSRGLLEHGNTWNFIRLSWAHRVCKHNASHQEITGSVRSQSVWSFRTFESVHYHNEISVSVSLSRQGRLGCWIARKSSANVEGLGTIEWCENCYLLLLPHQLIFISILLVTHQRRPILLLFIYVQNTRMVEWKLDCFLQRWEWHPSNSRQYQS